MINRLCVCLSIFMAAVSFTVVAQDEVSSKISVETSETIIAKLKLARPDFRYGEVQATPITGLYSVQVEQGPLLYVSEGGDFALTGTIYGVAPGGFIDLKELSMIPKRKASLEAVSASDTIIFPAQNDTKAIVHVFTDIDCGYCRKLHQEVPAMNAKGIEVRYLAFPRAGINSGSYRKIAKAWCAGDRNETLTKLKQNQPVEASYCADNPVAEQYELGNRIGISGTPAIVLEDGRLLPGYLTASQLEDVLNAGS